MYILLWQAVTDVTPILNAKYYKDKDIALKQMNFFKKKGYWKNIELIKVVEEVHINEQ